MPKNHVMTLGFICNNYPVDLPVKERRYGGTLQTNRHSLTKSSQGLGLAHSLVIWWACRPYPKWNPPSCCRCTAYMKPNIRYFTSLPICDTGDNGNAPCKFGKCWPVALCVRWITTILVILSPQTSYFFFFSPFLMCLICKSKVLLS